MRRTVFLICILMLTAGCARKGSPGAKGDIPVVGGANPAVSPEGSMPVAVALPAGPVVQGRTAPQWAQQLENRNHAVRSQASVALADMGEVGYPHLAAGLNSSSDEVRILCLQVITKPVLLDHANEMVPLLIRMLRDREPMIRRSAAARLCWFGEGARNALPYLREVAAGDSHLDIRQVAQVSIELIENARAAPTRGVRPDKLPSGD